MLARRVICRILLRQSPRESSRTLGQQTSLLELCGRERKPASLVQVQPPNCRLSTQRLATGVGRSRSTQFHVARSFASRKGKKGAQKSSEPSDSEDSEDDLENDPLEDDSDYEAEQESAEPKAYKDITRVVASLRLDAVLKAGLDTSRHKIEEEFYANKLRVNGQKVVKKGTTLKEGDTVDLILNTQGGQDGTMHVSRLLLLKKEAQKTQAGNSYVQLRRWKVLAVPKKRPGVSEETAA